MTSIGNRIVSGTIWSAAETWGREATSLTVFVLLARLLGPGAIGLVALAMTAPLIFLIPVAQGIPDAVIQRTDLEPIHVDSAYWFVVGLGAVLTGLIWVSSPLIALAFDEPALEDLVRWTSLIVVIYAVASVPSAMLRRELQFRLFAIRTMLGTMVGGATGIGLALSGFGVWSLVAMNVVRVLVETIFIFQASTWRPSLRFSYAKCRDLFGFAGPIVAQSFVRVLNDEIPKLAIGTFLSPSAVGVYSLARKPMDLLTNVLVQPLNQVAMPAVARVQNDSAKIDRFFNTGVRLAALVAFPAFVGFASIASIVVPTVLGAEWWGAIAAVQIMMLLGLQRTIDGLCSQVILALGHSGLLFGFHLAYTVIGAVFFSLGAQFSLEATVFAVVAANFVLLPVFLYQVRKLAHIDVMAPLRMFPRLVVASGIMYAAVALWRQYVVADISPLIAIATCVVVGLVAYGAAITLLLRPDVIMARDLLAGLRGGAGGGLEPSK